MQHTGNNDSAYSSKIRGCHALIGRGFSHPIGCSENWLSRQWYASLKPIWFWFTEPQSYIITWVFLGFLLTTIIQLIQEAVTIGYSPTLSQQDISALCHGLLRIYCETVSAFRLHSMVAECHWQQWWHVMGPERQ